MIDAEAAVVTTAMPGIESMAKPAAAPGCCTSAATTGWFFTPFLAAMDGIRPVRHSPNCQPSRPTPRGHANHCCCCHACCRELLPPAYNVGPPPPPAAAAMLLLVMPLRLPSSSSCCRNSWPDSRSVAPYSTWTQHSITCLIEQQIDARDLLFHRRNM